MVSFVRTIIMYVIVIFVMRCMGKRQIGQLQPYEFVIALMISDLAALPMQDSATPLMSGIIPILSLLLAQLTISFFIMKNKRFRGFICGRPSVVIRNGDVVEKNLRNEMYNLDDLLEALRLKGYPSVNDVLLATLENNGELSVIPYSRADTVRREDLQIQAAEGVVTDPIVGGYLVEENLNTVQIAPQTLVEEIQKAGADSIQDVFYCYVDSEGSFFTQLKKAKQKNSGGNV